jgi:Fe-S cluster assembly iron-binding protein IscA
MALDEPRKGDELFEDKGIKFVIEKDLFEKVKPIHVDFITTPMGSGFKLTSSLAVGAGCGSSCGTSCGS